MKKQWIDPEALVGRFSKDVTPPDERGIDWEFQLLTEIYADQGMIFKVFYFLLEIR